MGVTVGKTVAQLQDRGNTSHSVVREDLAKTRMRALLAAADAPRAFAAQLRELRRACKLSQRDVARRSGLSHSAINRLEHGHVSPQLSSVVSVAIALDVSPEDLLFDSALSAVIARSVTSFETSVLAAFRSLAQRDQQMVLAMVRRLADEHRSEGSHEEP